MDKDPIYTDAMPFARDVLITDFYKPEAIHTKGFEVASATQVRSTFVFPEYQRTQQLLKHVSAAQIQEGLMEGLYCAIAHYCESQVTLTREAFKAAMPDAIFYTMNLEFRRMLEAGESAQLSYEIIEVKEKRIRHQFYSVLTQVNGFLRGQVECLLPKK